MKSVESLHVILSVTFIVAVMLAAATATAVTMIRRAIERTRRKHTPEYWRMYARACDARAEVAPRPPQSVPDIEFR